MSQSRPMDRTPPSNTTDRTLDTTSNTTDRTLDTTLQHYRQDTRHHLQHYRQDTRHHPPTLQTLEGPDVGQRKFPLLRLLLSQISWNQVSFPDYSVLEYEYIIKWDLSQAILWLQHINHSSFRSITICCWTLSWALQEVLCPSSPIHPLNTLLEAEFFCGD